MSEQDNQQARADKKTEAIEIRVPFETKQMLTEKCRNEGLSVSEVLRGAIDNYLHGSNPHYRAQAWIFGSAVFILSLVVASAWLILDLKDENAALQVGKQKATAVAEAFNRSWRQAEEGGLAGNPLADLHFASVDLDQDGRLTLEEFIKGITERGSIATGDVGAGETILRTVGVGLVMQQEDAEALRQSGLIERCFASLAEIGDTERAREFYALDKNSDNLLALEEFKISQRIPSLYELYADFISKDEDGDALLSFEEAQEDIALWKQNNTTTQNRNTHTIVGEVPESCRIPEADEPEGRLQIRFEKLKRFIHITGEEGRGGVSTRHFGKLDINEDSSLSFAEFVAWYNQTLLDVLS
jgi:hypothetical protein